MAGPGRVTAPGLRNIPNIGPVLLKEYTQYWISPPAGVILMYVGRIALNIGPDHRQEYTTTQLQCFSLKTNFGKELQLEKKSI